ncbi:MAG: 3-deoxy-D-manno-octulosonic acid transferase [Thermovirgaceae bacterium]
MLTSVFYVAAFPYLAVRYRSGFRQRMGLYSPSDMAGLRDKPGRPLWVHAVSVGEVQAAFPLVREIKKDWKSGLFLTTITPTGRTMAEKLVGADADAMAYYPWDAPWVVSRAFRRIYPSAYITVETEIWPGLLARLSREGVPAYIANGRFSERSFRKALRDRDFWKDVLGCFRKIIVRSDEDASRLRELGLPGDKVAVTGDCKVDALLARRKAADPEGLRARLNGSGLPVLLAGSTHEGEEKIVLEAYKVLRQSGRRARLVIVPRHPERAPHVAEKARKMSGAAVLLSKLRGDWEILVVDELGVLFDLYALSKAAFIGGSLVPKGGQNVLEAAVWGVPVQHGPHMEDFSVAVKELRQRNAAEQVTSAEELAKSWIDILDDENAEERGSGAKRYVEELGGSAARSWEIIRQTLPDRE